MSGCANGCTSRNHLADCDDPECPGCEPWPTEADDLLCPKCIHRTRLDLSSIPDLVVHIRDHVNPGSPGPRSEAKHTKGDSAPAPLNLSAIADADDLHAAVAELVEIVVDGRGLVGPQWAGTDVRPASKRRTDWGDLVYQDARAVGVKDASATAGLVAWLIPHLDWLVGQEHAIDAISQTRHLVRVARNRWPITERPRYLPAPCPDCDKPRLIRYAPQFVGLPVTIACGEPSCGGAMTEDIYDAYARAIIAESRTA